MRFEGLVIAPLTAADEAMYAAKTAGKARYRLVDVAA
jgi:PleD family two-component response regulator